MNLSNKHQNISARTMQDFKGGLNTSVPSELIAENQLSELVNMEINKAGQLRTALGTKILWSFNDLSADIISAEYDNINDVLLLFCTDGTIYAWDGTTINKVGELTGAEEVVAVCWEDGILIASGSFLQYGKYEMADSKKLGGVEKEYKIRSLINSPPVSKGVYVRSGRVFIFDGEDNLRYSAVGDEETWEQDSNDPSAAIFTQIGYKVGGKIVGLLNFQSYVLIIKDNGKIFRLENEYPDWTIKEVTSNGLCMSKLACTSVGNNVFVLGKGTLQSIAPTDDAGNMPINYVGKEIEKEISNLSTNTKLRFVPALNQLWFITRTQWVLVFDCNTQTFYQRYFNSDVVDVVGSYIIKRNKVCELCDTLDAVTDDNKPLKYYAKFKTEQGLNDILVKHIDLSITPLASSFTNPDCKLKVGRITVPFPNRLASDNTEQRTVGVSNNATVPRSTFLSGATSDVFLNRENISVGKSILYKKRQVCRCDRVDVSIEGKGFPFVLNYISYNKIEV